MGHMLYHMLDKMLDHMIKGLMITTLEYIKFLFLLILIIFILL